MLLESIFGLIFLVFSLPNASAGLFDYFLPHREASTHTGVKALPSVPYELSEIDEKFIQEGAKLIGASMSQLDVCHHRVILTLKKSCREMNAEQLGKLAVMLLNCQSDSEGRAMYECTGSMSLKDCTQPMDAETWNAYHLITNRAKAICAAVRQEQFRGLTEMTVNKLMQTAHDQITLMTDLSATQDRLQMATQKSLNDLADNNQRLIHQQQEMFKVSDEHRSSIENNLQDIMNEKNLIKAGQLEVAQMIDDLKQKLDAGLITLESQTSQSRANHADLLHDLSTLHENAVQVSGKLEEAMEYVLKQSAIASVQFDATVHQLNDINKTVFDVADLIEQLRNDLEEQLLWISDKVGGTEMFMVKLQLTVQYVGFLLLGMLMLVFVNAAVFYRMVFLVGVVFTYGLNISGLYAIRMMQMNVALATVFLGHFMYQNFPWLFGGSFILKKKEDSSDGVVEDQEASNKSSRDNISEFSFQRRESHAQTRTPMMNRFLEDNNNNHSRSVTPFSTTMTPHRMRCTAVTQKGDQCRHAAQVDGVLCRVHFRMYDR